MRGTQREMRLELVSSRRPELVGDNVKKRDTEQDGGRNWWWELMGQALEKRERVSVMHFDE
jgi:hypothetical protein